MTPFQQAQNYAARRAQALRNMKSHITDILRSSVRDIVARTAPLTTASNKALFKSFVVTAAGDILSGANSTMEQYIKEYSKASIKVLGDSDSGAITRLINGELFGKTFAERNNTYIGYFANDIANLLFACRKLRMSRTETESALLKHFRDPYSSDVISRANREQNADIQVPSYGRGIYHSAFQNIVRNAQGVIAIAWGRELAYYARHNNDDIVGFRVHRGSSFPCDICDDEVNVGVHPLTDQMPPFHVNCVCWVEFVKKGENV